jgi:hypothetical protein
MRLLFATPILARFALVRPGRTLRLLSCHRSVGGLRRASPAVSFAKLPTQRKTQHVWQFEWSLATAGAPILL